MTRALALSCALIVALAAPAAASAAGHASKSRSKPPARSQPKPPPPPPVVAPAATPEAAIAGLVGLAEAEARARLGVPDVARSEGAGALWTYRLKDCALMVFFRASGGQPLRISGAASGQRRRGEDAAPVNVCIAEAETEVLQAGASPRS